MPLFWKEWLYDINLNCFTNCLVGHIVFLCPSEMKMKRTSAELSSSRRSLAQPRGGSSQTELSDILNLTGVSARKAAASRLSHQAQEQNSILLGVRRGPRSYLLHGPPAGRSAVSRQDVPLPEHRECRSGRTSPPRRGGLFVYAWVYKKLG